MSATINFAPSPAATTAQIAVQGASDTATAATDTGTADSGIGSFGALFQQLLGKQPLVAAEPVMPVTPAPSADATLAAEVNPTGTLAALLPFLEGMGLIITETADAGRDIEDPAMQDTDDVDAAALAGIAPALTPQLVADAAISAAQATSGKSTQASTVFTDGQSGLQDQMASLVSGDKTKTVAQATAGNSTQASTAFTEGQSGLQAQIASLTSRGKTDSQGAESSSNSDLQVQTPSLLAGNKTEGQVSAFSSKFAATLEAAADKVAATTTTSNPAGQISQPIGSPLASNQTSPVPTLPVDQHVGAAGWGQEVGNRLVWMSSSTNSHAELVLTPPQMGRVEVSLSVTGDQATATFVSTNPAVREALEAAMPRLREILADAGIQLGQTQVGAENAHQSAQQEKNGDNFAFGRNAPPDAGTSQSIATAPQPASPGLKVGRGLVDVFA